MPIAREFVVETVMIPSSLPVLMPNVISVAVLRVAIEGEGGV